jgi:hypothetical protein
MNVVEVNNPVAGAKAAPVAPEVKPVSGKWILSDAKTKEIHHKNPQRTEISLRSVLAQLVIAPSQLKVFNLPAAIPAKVDVKFSKVVDPNQPADQKRKKSKWTWDVKTTNLSQETDLFRKIYASLPNVLECYMKEFNRMAQTGTKELKHLEKKAQKAAHKAEKAQRKVAALKKACK